MYKVPNHPVFKSFGIMRLPSGTYLCPGWIKVPDGTTREDVKWEKDLPKSSIPVFKEFDVKGLTGDYRVTLSDQFGNSCTCTGFKFRKHCKSDNMKNEIKSTNRAAKVSEAVNRYENIRDSRVSWRKKSSYRKVIKNRVNKLIRRELKSQLKSGQDE